VYFTLRIAGQKHASGFQTIHNARRRSRFRLVSPEPGRIVEMMPMAVDPSASAETGAQAAGFIEYRSDVTNRTAPSSLSPVLS